MNNKGQKGIGVLSLLLTGGIILVVVAVSLGIGVNVLTDLYDARNATDFAGYTQNTSLEGVTGLGNIAGNLGLLGTVLGLSVVLLILVTLLYRQFARGV